MNNVSINCKEKVVIPKIIIRDSVQCKTYDVLPVKANWTRIYITFSSSFEVSFCSLYQSFSAHFMYKIVFRENSWGKFDLAYQKNM